MNVKERLVRYIKSHGISQRAFEKTVGLSNGYVNNIRKSIQPDKIQRIALFFPDLNTGWLLTGEGEMYNTLLENKGSLTLKLRVDELTEENKFLREKNELLIHQVGYLQGQIDLLTGDKK